MPLDEKSQWAYQVRSPLHEAVWEVAVEGRAPVGSFSGWRLSGPAGESTLAWQNGVLYAGKLSGTTYVPPIPLLATDQKPRAWKGQIIVAGAASTARANLEFKEEETQVGTKSVTATLSILTLTLEEGQIEIMTWFSSGLGIIRQEQRESGSLSRKLTYLSGP